MTNFFYMAWLMNTTNPVEDAVKDALAYFEKKYGKPPSVIVCNPSLDIKGQQIAVEKYQPVLANLLYIGELENENQDYGNS